MTAKVQVIARVRVTLDVIIDGYDPASSLEKIEADAREHAKRTLHGLIDPSRTSFAQGVVIAEPVEYVQVTTRPLPGKLRP